MTARRVPDHLISRYAPRSSDLLIVVPVINEGVRIRAQLERMHHLGHGLDVAVADGGSTDGSLDEGHLRSVGVRALLTKQGSGKLSAQLRMAFAFALDEGYDGVVTIDGNGKDGVDGIPLVAVALRNGDDYVQGSRFMPGGKAINTPAARYWAIRLLHAPITSIGARRWYTDTTNGFRGHSARLLSDPRVDPFREVFCSYELLAYLPVRAGRLGLRTSEVPVARIYPEGDVPTKIKSISGHMELLAVVLRAAGGRYDPTSTPAVGCDHGVCSRRR